MKKASLNKKHFIRILRKYREGTATAEETRFVEAYYDILGAEPVTDEWLREEGAAPLSGQMLEGIWEKIRAAEAPPAQSKQARMGPLVRQAAAVALLLVVTGVVAYLGLQRQKRLKGQAVAIETGSAAKGIHPGGSHAVLTLANGRQLVLDSLQEGSKLKQGGMQITKLGKGQLVYQATAAEPATDGRTLFNTITTPRGGEYQLVLPDGSKVWLNAQSSLRFPTSFSREARRVALRGEAYFEIAPRPGQPFIVHTGELSIKVLGTRFNVNAYADNSHVRTVLAEGAVKVVKGPYRRVLQPGEEAAVDRATGSVQVGQANLDQALAWKNGLFYFDHTHIKTIMQQVARWYNVRVEYQTTHMEANYFSGVVSRYSEVDALLKRLALTGAVHFTIRGDTITVSD